MQVRGLFRLRSSGAVESGTSPSEMTLEAVRFAVGRPLSLSGSTRGTARQEEGELVALLRRERRRGVDCAADVVREARLFEIAAGREEFGIVLRALSRQSSDLAARLTPGGFG